MLKRIVFLWVLLSAAVGWAQETNRVENGHSQAEVVARLGEPEGNITSGKSTYLTYAGLRVKLTDGVVADLDPQFNEKLAEARQTDSEKEAFAAEQRAKGLVKYQGRWLTAEEYETTKITEIQHQVRSVRKDMDVKRYTVKRKDGTVIDHKELIVDEKPTVVAFLVNGHLPSRKLAEALDKLTKDDSGVRLRMLAIKPSDEKLTTHFNILSLPHVRVLDAYGNLVAIPSQDLEKIEAAIKQAKRQSRVTKIYVN